MNNRSAELETGGMMTIEELREYRFIKAKIVAINAEIEALYHPVGSPAPKEVISGVSSVRPAGNPTKEAVDRIEALNSQLDKLQAEATRIETWVDNISDRMISALIQTHYLAGYSWRQTARKIYGKRSNGDTCRMMVRRYVEKSCS